MNTTVYKYELLLWSESHIEMPQDAAVLTVQLQRGNPCLWALVDPSKPTVCRRFIFVGTGHPGVCDTDVYIGTVQLQGGDLVLHFFEVKT